MLRSLLVVLSAVSCSTLAMAGFPVEFFTENQYASVKVIAADYQNSFEMTPKVPTDRAFFIIDGVPPTEACGKTAFLTPLIKTGSSFKGSFYTGMGHLPETQSFILCLFSGDSLSGYIVGEGLYLND